MKIKTKPNLRVELDITNVGVQCGPSEGLSILRAKKSSHHFDIVKLANKHKKIPRDRLLPQLTPTKRHNMCVINNSP